jgi:hypothetical protein
MRILADTFAKTGWSTQGSIYGKTVICQRLMFYVTLTWV